MTYEIRMSTDEMKVLWRQIRATWPASLAALEDATVPVWYASLARYRYADCTEAVTNLAARESFADISAIVTEVRRIREVRASRHKGVFYKPSRGDLTEAEQREELRLFNRALADGEPPPHREALATRDFDVRAITDGKPMPGSDDRPAAAPVSARARALARVYREREAAAQQ